MIGDDRITDLLLIRDEINAPDSGRLTHIHPEHKQKQRPTVGQRIVNVVQEAARYDFKAIAESGSSIPPEFKIESRFLGVDRQTCTSATSSRCTVTPGSVVYAFPVTGMTLSAIDSHSGRPGLECRQKAGAELG